MHVDILTLGNALIDLLVNLSDTTPFCRVDAATDEICIKAGEKIPAEHVGFSIGGGACRVAIGMKRLGFSSAICAEIGNDELAGRIKKVLSEEGVDTSYLVQVPQVTSFTVGLNFQKERTLFTHHAHATHAFDLEAIEAKWIYIASLSAPWEKAYAAVFAKKAAGKTKIAWNPGLAQLSEGVDLARSMVKDADILFLNKQEAQMLVGSKEDDIKLLLLKLSDMGATIVVITDGRKGSYGISKERQCYQMGIMSTHVAERTGAGDAYATGFLAAMMNGKHVEESMMWGALNSSAVVGQLGGVLGLLTEEGIGESLQKEKENLIVREI